MRSERGGLVNPVEALSDLEKEALRLFLVSSDQRELARRVGRSPATVEQRLARARRKLGVARTLDAALLLAEREGVSTYGTNIYGGHASPIPSPESLAEYEKIVPGLSKQISDLSDKRRFLSEQTERKKFETRLWSYPLFTVVAASTGFFGLVLMQWDNLSRLSVPASLLLIPVAAVLAFIAGVIVGRATK